MGAGEVSLCIRKCPKFGEFGEVKDSLWDLAPELVRSREKLASAVM